ncbi:hypothetical protein RBS60_03065 [Sinomonas sp. ASV486]|uniref:hypothetical protein n=1 Tax=Sinomonas sp. ASV486 TaxID=3051170 RepID=UPI0027DC7EB8|nr:hypothetical protein [Sinomonas sp. ASV486]MDQ4489175.1 hypothetical protein [Sinomonas sp. ASV486]
MSSGALLRISYGAYYEAKAWECLSEEDQHLAVLAAHYPYHSRRGRPGFLYSHLSAARAYGIDLWNPDALVHVMAPTAVARGRRREDVVIHRGEVPPEQRGFVGGLPVTSLERTIVDSARVLRPGQAQIVVDHGLRLGAEPDVLRELVETASGRRGVLTARRALDLGSGLSESAAESLLNYLLAGMPFPRPQQQIRVETRYGRHRVDAGWPAVRRGIEMDGRNKYFDFAPTDDVIFRERQREKALMEDGWLFLRLEWRDLFQPTVLEARITKLIASAGPEGEAMLRRAQAGAA